MYMYILAITLLVCIIQWNPSILRAGRRKTFVVRRICGTISKATPQQVLCMHDVLWHAAC